MVNLSFGDMIVVRWCATFDRQSSLRGLTNRTYNFSQLKALGFWEHFQSYFKMTRNLLKAKLDAADLGIVATLVIITADRALLNERDRVVIYQVQEHLARILKAKCDLEGTGFLF